MKLSILIPLYNAEKHILRCLNSLVYQGLKEDQYEILLLDDGSKDDSFQVTNEFAKAHTNIIVKQQQNQGAYPTRTNLLEMAKGTYIYFVDADDYLTPNSLGGLLEKMEDKNLDMLGFASTVATPEKKVIPLEDSDKILDPVTDGYSFLINYRYRNEIWWYIIKKEFLKSTGLVFHNNKMLEDVRFTMELLLKAKRISFLPLKVHHYFEHENSLLHTTNPTHFNNSIIEFRRTIREFTPIIRDLDRDNSKYNLLHDKLKARQESFTFFMIIRYFKSNQSFKDLKVALKEAKEHKAYPFTYFPNHEYQANTYKILTIVFNNSLLLYSSFQSFRLFKKVKG
ncbi:glycosyltransferase [Aquimarina sp. ERC-38]|uniref:glycosyltransferase n=1 Tax=Aquimarina sp. ERC-38 TaxID=2949996 RepID=UPI002245B762|nr:glycosyltransferase [Aquimarina sp. ERC-38]UZO82367.1 glycosyltransferase [Aquimarina sp. ERC-38]